MEAVKMNHPNKGISCKVHSCYFYSSGDYCTANKIEVEPSDAHSVSETGCATFKPKML